MHRMKTYSGFTLLEVVVAMAIVGLGIVTLLEVFSLGLRLEAKSSLKTESVVYGQQIIDELFVRHEIGDGKDEGMAGDKYRWRIKIDPYVEGPSLHLLNEWELKEIMLDMRYKEGAPEKSIEMRTLRLVKKKP